MLMAFVSLCIRRAEETNLLSDVQELFADASTRRFWPWVLQGDGSAVAPLRRLGVADSSWVWRQIVLDAIGEWSTWTDKDRLVGHVGTLLSALESHELIVDSGCGAILDRLARERPVDEQGALREIVVQRWGSPLLPENGPKWERWCGEPARRLVSGWLTQRVIATFFGVLAGGQADQRRTTFWSRYADRIDELWVYLCEETRSRGGEPLREMRRVLGRAVLAVDDDNTNVFVMMIGDYAFVEFSTTGNALYVYSRETLPFKLERGRQRVPAFRDRAVSVVRLTHQGGWEDRARTMIGDLTANWVSSTYSSR
jgi:hypothetical protein